MIEQIHLYISGDVQGVGLRYSLKQKADLLNLVGWVKNLSDGRVEAVIQGEEKNIKKILNWLPTYTWIEDIEIKKEPLERLFGFEIKF
ncbi:MAG: acylphosphatase [Patescibacteria group bacterium]